MEPFPCFVCGTVTTIYCKDVASLQSKFSETFIIKYLEKFVGHDLSDHLNRSNNGTSIICQNCIIKIDEYDESYMNAVSLEDNLRNMLIKTLEKEKESENDIDSDSDDIFNNNEEMEEEEVQEIKRPKSPSMFCSICHRNFDR